MPAASDCARACAAAAPAGFDGIAVPADPDAPEALEEPDTAGANPPLPTVDVGDAEAEPMADIAPNNRVTTSATLQTTRRPLPRMVRRITMCLMNASLREGSGALGHDEGR